MAEASKLNLVDRSIAYFSPKAALSRFNARRSYEAATMGRRGKSFKGANSAGPNLEISQGFITLRNRSRHFVRNNGWAKRAINAIANNTVGEGIRPAPVGTKSQVKKIKAIWKDWAETTACDWNGKNTFYGLQRIVMSKIAEAGDCLIVRRRVTPTRENPLPIKLQVLEGDQLDHCKDGINDKGFARLGVQFDEAGLTIGYWIWPQHPTDMTGKLSSLQSQYFSVNDIIHPFELLRISQVRGVPMGISSFIKMSDFSNYEDAQLVRQKAAAAFCAFRTGREGVASSDLESLEPGIIEDLGEGETIEFSKPPAADGYAEYSKKILQGIAAAYGITYEMLTMDYSNVNFTSGRMAKIDITPNFRNWQYNMMVPQVCVNVWRWFMDAVIMTGLSSTKVVCNATDWTAPRVQQLDPVKETNARVLQLQAGLTTWSESVREDGRDPQEFLDEIIAERKLLADAGITFSSIMIAPEPLEPDPNIL